MEVLPIIIGVVAVMIVFLLPNAKRLAGIYSPYLSTADLTLRIIVDANIGGAPGAFLSGLLSYSILNRYILFLMRQSEFSQLLVSCLFGWLIAAPAGGILFYVLLKRRIDRRMPVIVAAAGFICACCPPLLYTAGAVFFRAIP